MIKYFPKQNDDEGEIDIIERAGIIFSNHDYQIEKVHSLKH
jgi:hypothetical protein